MFAAVGQGGSEGQKIMSAGLTIPKFLRKRGGALI